MIREVAVVALVVLALLSSTSSAQTSSAAASSEATTEPSTKDTENAGEVTITQPGTTSAPVRVVDDTSLETWRTPLQALNEHFIGSAARPVRFDWRRSPAMFVLRANEVIERNSFGQWQLGVMVRKAFGDILLDGGINAFFAYDTPSSQLLALTPFRQAGRPNHFQLELNVGYAVAEGVVTPLFSWMPPMEMVLVAQGGLRYLVYVESFTGGRNFTTVATSIASPQLTIEEIQQLERSGPDGMQIDPARLHVPVGFSLDIYVQPGVVIAPRAMVLLPVLSPLTASELGFVWELGLSIGYAL